ncbi:MAG: hypothetical protein EBU88_14535, partial [Acidobacteria bacterium]|nr:hypothetical protein [Acidobacteriota bacterium]
MPPMLVPSPAMLDQSFPRSTDELMDTVGALGQLEELIRQGAVQIILTPTLCDFLQGFDWSREEHNRIITDVYRLLAQWALQQSDGARSVDLDDVSGHSPHPVPNEFSSVGLIEVWADEIGRLLKCHDDECSEYCIGIASNLAFSGGTCMGYPSSAPVKAFPLVGPKSIDRLADAYEYI